MANNTEQSLLIEVQNIDVRNGDFLKNLIPPEGIKKIVAIIEAEATRARVDELTAYLVAHVGAMTNFQSREIRERVAELERHLTTEEESE